MINEYSILAWMRGVAILVLIIFVVSTYISNPMLAYGKKADILSANYSVENVQAILVASINAHGSKTRVWFEWGTEEDALVYKTNAGTAIGNSGEAVVYTLHNLDRWTTYYFRPVANSVDGTVKGPILSFTTEGVYFTGSVSDDSDSTRDDTDSNTNNNDPLDNADFVHNADDNKDDTDSEDDADTNNALAGAMGDEGSGGAFAGFLNMFKFGGYTTSNTNGNTDGSTGNILPPDTTGNAINGNDANMSGVNENGTVSVDTSFWEGSFAFLFFIIEVLGAYALMTYIVIGRENDILKKKQPVVVKA
jgi:hypothetical protein